MTSEAQFHRANRNHQCVWCKAYDITVNHELKVFVCHQDMLEFKQENPRTLEDWCFNKEMELIA